MSRYIAFYAEVKVGQKWFFLGPSVRDVNGVVKTQPVLSGQSYLLDTVDELRNYSHSTGLPVEMSAELTEVFQPDKLCEGYFGKPTTHREYYQHYAFTVKCDVIADRIKKDKPFKYAGYVLKQTVVSYEIDDCDGIYDWLTSDEYKALPSEQQREYQYYEWNDWGGWYGFFNMLYQRIIALLDWFQDGGIPFSYDCPPEEKYPTLSDVRLIVISE